MTPKALADLHARCITVPRPWSEAEFAGLLQMPGTFCLGDSTGFALGRALAGEAELLTLVVAPNARRTGLGRHLLTQFEGEAIARRSEAAFLEVAADNTAARALYAQAGYTRVGHRANYYQSAQGPIDALVLRRNLTKGHLPNPVADARKPDTSS